MLWLSKLFTGVGGSSLTIPVLIVGLLMMWHQRTESKEAGLRNEGKLACNQDWLVARSKQEQEAARRDAEQAMEILAEERKITEGLNHELEKTRSKYAGYIPGNDPRCLSDGVLDALRRRQSVGSGG